MAFQLHVPRSRPYDFLQRNRGITAQVGPRVGVPEPREVPRVDALAARVVHEVLGFVIVAIR